jgi:hypothetical protein
MHFKDPPNDVLINIDAKRESNLLGNSPATPTGITAFHLNDSIDKFAGWAFRAPSPSVFGRKEHAVLPLNQHLVETQQSGWLQNDSRFENSCRSHQKGAQTGDNSIGNAQIGSPLSAAVQDQKLMSNQHGFRNDGP